MLILNNIVNTQLKIAVDYYAIHAMMQLETGGTRLYMDSKLDSFFDVYQTFEEMMKLIEQARDHDSGTAGLEVPHEIPTE